MLRAHAATLVAPKPQVCNRIFVVVEAAAVAESPAYPHQGMSMLRALGAEASKLRALTDATGEKEGTEFRVLGFRV